MGRTFSCFTAARVSACTRARMSPATFRFLLEGWREGGRGVKQQSHESERERACKSANSTSPPHEELHIRVQLHLG